MVLQALLALVMLVQAPTSRPSTQPVETYPALRRLLEKTQAELNTALTELRQLRDENQVLRAELAAIRNREDQRRDVAAKYKLTPEQSKAFEEGVILVGMPLEAVKDLCHPSKLYKTSASTSADWYEVSFGWDSLFTVPGTPGRFIRSDSTEPISIGVDPQTGLVFAVNGPQSLPGDARRNNAKVKAEK